LRNPAKRERLRTAPQTRQQTTEASLHHLRPSQDSTGASITKQEDIIVIQSSTSRQGFFFLSSTLLVCGQLVQYILCRIYMTVS